MSLCSSYCLCRSCSKVSRGGASLFRFPETSCGDGIYSNQVFCDAGRAILEPFPTVLVIREYLLDALLGHNEHLSTGEADKCATSCFCYINRPTGACSQNHDVRALHRLSVCSRPTGRRAVLHTLRRLHPAHKISVGTPAVCLQNAYVDREWETIFEEDVERPTEVCFESGVGQGLQGL